jgi:hypothetical protein
MLLIRLGPEEGGALGAGAPPERRGGAGAPSERRGGEGAAGSWLTPGLSGAEQGESEIWSLKARGAAAALRELLAE